MDTSNVTTADQFNKFYCFVADVANKVHNLAVDTLKIALSDVLPTPNNALFSDIVEIAAGQGYVAGGVAVSIGSSTQIGGVYKLLAASDAAIIAQGNMATFRYGVLYNSSAPMKNLIGWWDFGVEINLKGTNQLAIAFDGQTGILQLS